MMRIIRKLILLALLALLVSVGVGVYFALKPMPLPRTPLEFSLKPGSSLKSAANQMKNAGVLENDLAFVLLSRCLGKAKQVKYGNYQLDQEISPYELLDVISSGRGEQSQITVIEGSTFNELRALMNTHPGLRHDSVLLSEAEVLKRIGATELAAEGLMFPDTYNFSSGSSDLVVLKRAYQTMQRHLRENWDKRDVDLPFESPYQALILASIVEKETGRSQDRPMIASVFINRLRKNMRLQTDPTVIYGMGDQFDGNLRKKDLERDTRYNTYTRDGLTPTPIALPGMASLQAVMHPAPSKALYFVARGDGSSQFSDSLFEHNNAVNRYQKK